MGLFQEKKPAKDEQIGNLGDYAAQRKAKLLALKKGRKQQNEEEKNDNEEHDDNLPTTKVLFRTYKPQNEDLENNVLPRAEPSDVAELVEDQIKDGENANEIGDVEIENLAPKKITFDLRRGVQKQLDKLDRRTDKAIAELIRQRLKEGRQQDFLLAVNAGAAAQRHDTFNSDDDD